MFLPITDTSFWTNSTHTPLHSQTDFNPFPFPFFLKRSAWIPQLERLLFTSIYSFLQIPKFSISWYFQRKTKTKRKSSPRFTLISTIQRGKIVAVFKFFFLSLRVAAATLNPCFISPYLPFPSAQVKTQDSALRYEGNYNSSLFCHLCSRIWVTSEGAKCNEPGFYIQAGNGNTFLRVFLSFRRKFWSCSVATFETSFHFLTPPTFPLFGSFRLIWTGENSLHISHHWETNQIHRCRSRKQKRKDKKRKTKNKKKVESSMGQQRTAKQFYYQYKLLHMNKWLAHYKFFRARIVHFRLEELRRKAEEINKKEKKSRGPRGQ